MTSDSICAIVIPRGDIPHNRRTGNKDTRIGTNLCSQPQGGPVSLAGSDRYLPISAGEGSQFLGGSALGRVKRGTPAPPVLPQWFKSGAVPQLQVWAYCISHASQIPYLHRNYPATCSKGVRMNSIRRNPRLALKLAICRQKHQIASTSRRVANPAGAGWKEQIVCGHLFPSWFIQYISSLIGGK